MKEGMLAESVTVKEVDGGFQAILDAIYCCVLIFNSRKKLIYCNRAARNCFRRMGIDAEEQYYTEFRVLSGPLEKQVSLSSGSGRYIIEIGKTHFVCNVSPWMIRNKRQGTLIVLHESLHSNCIMQELDVTSSLLKEISIFVESSHDGFLVTDSKGVVIRVNASFEEAFHLHRQEVIGRKMEKLLEEAGIRDSAVLKVLKTKKTATVVLNQFGKRLISTGTPVYDDEKNFTSVVVNVRDITELNDLMHRLDHQRMVAEGYSRELNYIRDQHVADTDIITHSKKMQHIMDTVKAVSQVDSTVLITGESGTGKEVIVNYLHRISSRKDKPLIKINCGAIPSSLFESEMFGYEEGAFTGARRHGKAGFFEMADGGILFLDEIGELDMNLQVKLLRVIQDGEVVRIGGARPMHVDVRIVAATNRNLWQQVENGNFRQDLYYRLNVINIALPPLRDRPDDVIPLAVHFMEKFNKKYGKEKKLSFELGKVLRTLDWQGNIRELENLIENMVVLGERDILYPEDLPDRYRRMEGAPGDGTVSVSGIMPLKDALSEVEKELLLKAQEKYHTTREIAKALGVSQATVSRKLKSIVN